MLSPSLYFFTLTRAFQPRNGRQMALSFIFPRCLEIQKEKAGPPGQKHIAPPHTSTLIPPGLANIFIIIFRHTPSGSPAPSLWQTVLRAPLRHTLLWKSGWSLSIAHLRHTLFGSGTQLRLDDNCLPGVVGEGEGTQSFRRTNERTGDRTSRATGFPRIRMKRGHARGIAGKRGLACVLPRVQKRPEERVGEGGRDICARVARRGLALLDKKLIRENNHRCARPYRSSGFIRLCHREDYCHPRIAIEQCHRYRYRARTAPTSLLHRVRCSGNRNCAGRGESLYDVRNNSVRGGSDENERWDAHMCCGGAERACENVLHRMFDRRLSLAGNEKRIPAGRRAFPLCFDAQRDLYRWKR